MINSMQELEQLIRKFWLNETSQEENQRLLQLLHEYKDQYRDEIRMAFGAEEREDIDESMAAGLLAKIHRNLGMDLSEPGRDRVHSIRFRYKYLAAAAAIGAVFFSVHLLAPRHRQQQPVLVKTGEVISPQPYLEHFTSSRNADTTLVLEDGSSVQLKENSRLTLYKPFRGDRRDIWLEGAATFDVKKDRSKPFTVYAGGVETRVLGTRFSVNASETDKVKVRLLEGKVVVSSNSTSGPVMKALYLMPGQELSFDRSSKLYTVNTIKPRTEKPASPDGVGSQSDLVFHKEPLNKVFQRIGVLYKVPLSYRKEELNGLYFTGTFLKSDDLHIVLSAICNVHGLAYREENDSITITRSH